MKSTLVTCLIILVTSLAFASQNASEVLNRFTWESYQNAENKRAFAYDSLVALKKAKGLVNQESKKSEIELFIRTVILVNHWAMRPDVVEYLDVWLNSDSPLIKETYKILPLEVQKSWSDSLKMHEYAQKHGTG